MKKTILVLFAVGIVVFCGFLIFSLLKEKDEKGITNLDGQETATILKGEKITLTARYKISTGYTAFPPKYDENFFQLVSKRETSTNNGRAGGDQTIVVYTFKALKETGGSPIEVGQYRTFDPEESLEIQEKVLISVVP